MRPWEAPPKVCPGNFSKLALKSSNADSLTAIKMCDINHKHDGFLKILPVPSWWQVFSQKFRLKSDNYRQGTLSNTVTPDKETSKFWPQIW
jgi:hypothetical protein